MGGDSFDWAAELGSLTVATMDAMGHGLDAAVTSALAVRALRSARRCNSSLAEQAATADQVLHQQFGGERFVTALSSRSSCCTPTTG